MKRLPPRVEVEWLDIVQTAEWRGRAEVEASQPAKCRSVGYLIKRDVARVVLAHTLNDDDSDYTTIPAGCVLRICKLRRAGEFAA